MFQTTPYLHGRGEGGYSQSQRRTSFNRDQNNNGHNFGNPANNSAMDTPTRAFTSDETQVPARNLVTEFNTTFGNQSNMSRNGKVTATGPRFGNRTWVREDGSEMAPKKPRMVIFFFKSSVNLNTVTIQIPESRPDTKWSGFQMAFRNLWTQTIRKPD